MSRLRPYFAGLGSSWALRRAFLRSCQLLALGLLLVAGCTKPPPPQPTQTAAKPTSLVVFYPANGGQPVRVHVELARTPDEHTTGLMYRRELGTDAGMLFLFPRPEIRRFWMRNCYIPLDMLFLDENRVVVGIEENTVPQDETGRGPDTPAQYVVEVIGGYTRSHGITTGAHAEFQNVP